MSIVSKLKKMGIALGANPYATASSSFTEGLLVSDFECNPTQTVEPIAEVRGSLNTFRTTKGPIEYKAKFAFPLDAGSNGAGSIGQLLASVYGAEAGTDVGALFQHLFTLAETEFPPYLNLWNDKDSTPKQYKGFRASSLKFAINAKDGLIPVECEGMLQGESSLTNQTLTYSDAPILVPSMISDIKLNGSAITELETVEITISRGQEGVNTLGNSRNINRLVSGKNFSISLALSGIVFATETERTAFLANTNSSFNLTLNDGTNELEFSFPEIKYQTYDGPSIKGEDIQRVSLVAIVTGSGHSITLTNSHAKNYVSGLSI